MMLSERESRAARPSWGETAGGEERVARRGAVVIVTQGLVSGGAWAGEPGAG